MLSHIRPTDRARVLLPTDQKVLAKTIALTLDHGAFMARTESDSRRAVATLREWHPHIVVADLDIKGVVSFKDILSTCAAGNAKTPNVALTRKADLKTTLGIFYAGVDDVITLPFAPEELLARVIAVTRRIYQAEPVMKPVLVVGGLRIDIMSRHVQVHGRLVALTSLELSILYLLAANNSNTLSRSEIINQLWEPDYVAKSKVIGRHIRNLRTKLDDDPRIPTFIYTVPGHGYRFAKADPTLVERKAPRHEAA